MGVMPGEVERESMKCQMCVFVNLFIFDIFWFAVFCLGLVGVGSLFRCDIAQCAVCSHADCLECGIGGG